MSYNTELQSNNIDLQTILDTINTLPEAGIDTSNATATADDILNGKSAYVNGSLVIGNIETFQIKEPIISPFSDGTITVLYGHDVGYYANDNNWGGIARYQLSVNDDPDLVGTNIIEGVSIFGVAGEIPNNGSISQTMDGIDTKSVTIPSGYTSGGTVSLDDTIDTEVNTQADLISQIATALEGKAAGGSGGAGVETCNIELSFTDFSSVQGAQYCTVNEGILNFVGDYFEDQQGHVLGGVACGSIVVVYAFAMDSSYVGDGDCTYLYGDNNLLIMIAPERSGDYAATIYGA